MCGIIYVRKHDGTKANKAVLKRFERQRERGTQGFGYVTIGNTAIVRRAEKEHDIKEKLAAEDASEILFHHRYPTSTGNYLDATHPILVGNPALSYTYLVVHNGIIENAEDLKHDHEARGFTYRTVVEHTVTTRHFQYGATQFNDSEAFAIDLALTLEGKNEAMRAKGSIAFIALQLARKTKVPVSLLWGRNDGAPLHIETAQQLIAITSQGAGKTVHTDTLYTYDYATAATSERPLAIGEYPKSELLGFQMDDWGDSATRGVFSPFSDTLGDWDDAYTEHELATLEEQLRDLKLAEDIARLDSNEEELQDILYQMARLHEDIAELQGEFDRPR